MNKHSAGRNRRLSVAVVCLDRLGGESGHRTGIIVDLLKMNVAPQAVFQTLKAMCAGQRVPESSDGGGIPSTKAEARAPDESSSSGKNPKMPAGAPAAPGPRSARVGAKMAAYGAQDVGSAPHAQAVRSKATSAADKAREGSGQRAQRQPSANRGQKTKSSGSSSSSSQM
ncbi:mitotic-spindle organizing protein 2 isoform X2 [Phyllopteryx taeniolatus]|uniref:mitotic-spindle organizing protein 2 isoform X2 n=1 Tax=Phyllopteryx taeniolatus TaxID=161469 RepID=UPI002AD32300|nr:mitotic-spindle organizing protein 2 isoform X2 [Phyllopteryx taeniolatus]